MRFAPLLAAAVALALPAAARADVKRAVDILPPGQSGFVSLPGVASGTGSPHLTDQQPLFERFQYKQHTFNQLGESEEVKPGVRIVRDKFGVPAVTAGSIDDAWFGGGYAIAQDRLFQIELFKRATSGRLAEILGKSYLDDDLIARRDYYTDAEIDAMLAKFPPELRARTDAYRDGVNAWIAKVRQDPSKLPGEFTALNVPLTDISARDIGRIGVFLARTVPSGDGAELDNLRALRAIGGKAFDALLPLRAPKRIATIPRETPAQEFPSQPGRTVAQEQAGFTRSLQVVPGFELPTPAATAAARARVAPGLVGQIGGSSMLAVRRPADKHAFLFNGPQLGFSVPELFVELEVHAPGYDVRGVTAPGIPVMGIGHNGTLAWGFTSGLSDEDDLYAEKLVPGQSERYIYQGAERQMDCRDEVFKFQTPPTDALSLTKGTVPDVGAGQVTERLCRTVHGPVQVRAGGTAYARRYAIFDRELETIVGIDQLNRAQTVSDVDAAMQNVTWNENVMAADSQGNIGYWHPGLHPLRPLDFDERLPYPGTGEAEWRGLLDRRQTPHVINPKQGFLVNWNNVPSEGWTSGDGEARERQTAQFHRVGWLRWLVDALAKKPSFELMMDHVRQEGTTAQQRPLARARLRKASRVATGDAKRVLDVLTAWDGSYARTDDAGTVDPGVATWEQFKDDAEKLALSRIGADRTEAEGLAGTPGKSHMFDITLGEAYALRTLTPTDYATAATATFAALRTRFGTDDVTKWREKRRLYDLTSQGAGSTDPLPFFDRGTWEQFVEVGP